MFRFCALAVLLGAPTARAQQHNASQDNVAIAQAAEQEATQRAEAAIAELAAWGSELNASVHNESFAADKARSLEAEALEEFRERKEEARRNFNASVATLHDPNVTNVDSANSAAAQSLRELKDTNHEEVHALWRELGQFYHAGKARVHALWKTAEHAARLAYHSGLAASRAQRKAGAHERTYEHTEEHSEFASERLELHAEEVADFAEDLVEQQADQVERQVEKRMVQLQDDAKQEWDALKHELRQARRSRESEQRARSATFLALAPGASAAVAMPRASIAMLAVSIGMLGALAVPAALGLLLCRRQQRSPFVQQPMLG